MKQVGDMQARLRKDALRFTGMPAYPVQPAAAQHPQYVVHQQQHAMQVSLGAASSTPPLNVPRLGGTGTGRLGRHELLSKALGSVHWVLLHASRTTS